MDVSYAATRRTTRNVIQKESRLVLKVNRYGPPARARSLKLDNNFKLIYKYFYYE